LKNLKLDVMEATTNQTTKPEIQYVIVHEEMVWQFYFDELGSKYFRELLGMEARKFIKSISAETVREEARKPLPK
jgi:hypothetical protein